MHKPITPLLLTMCAALLAFTQAALADPFKLTEEKGLLKVEINGQPFTTYRFTKQADDPQWNRPYFWPVLASDNTEVTSDQWRLTQTEKTDHPWHRSIYVAHGDVNGLDHWQLKEPVQKHVRFTKLDADSFVEELEWSGKPGEGPALLETRTVKFVAYPDGARGIDITSLIKPGAGPVEFKTKPLNVSGVEAGWCSVRVAKSMWEDKAKQITSSAPAAGEKEARSKPADWCDYSAHINGKMYGVAMFDSPTNAGHPTPWHVREFGLLAHIGPHDWTLAPEKTATFRHRIIIHTGDGKSANLDEKYKQFAAEK